MFSLLNTLINLIIGPFARVFSERQSVIFRNESECQIANKKLIAWAVIGLELFILGFGTFLAFLAAVGALTSC